MSCFSTAKADDSSVPCEKQESSCSQLNVPLDYSNPQLGQLQLSIEDFPETTNKNAPVIFVHGGPAGDHRGLAHLLRPFFKNNRFIYYEQRGGDIRSQIPDELVEPATLNIASMVKDLEHVIDTMAPGQKVILYAHSFGGLIALQFALEHPDKVEKLILHSTFMNYDFYDDGYINLTKSKVENLLVTRSQDLEELDKAFVGDSEAVVYLRELKDHLEELAKEGTLSATSDIADVETRIKKLHFLLAKSLKELDTDGLTQTLEYLNNNEVSPAEINDMFRPPQLSNKKYKTRFTLICGELLSDKALEWKDSRDIFTLRDYRCRGFSRLENSKRGVQKDDLKNLRIPVLILSGSMDNEVDAHYQVELFQSLNSKVQYVPFYFSEHEAYRTEALKFDRVVNSFLLDRRQYWEDLAPPYLHNYDLVFAKASHYLRL